MNTHTATRSCAMTTRRRTTRGRRGWRLSETSALGGTTKTKKLRPGGVAPLCHVSSWRDRKTWKPHTFFLILHGATTSE